MIVTPGHRWNNEEYYNHTGLETYANYMFGGGYILSSGRPFHSIFSIQVMTNHLGSSARAQAKGKLMQEACL